MFSLKKAYFPAWLLCSLLLVFCLGAGRAKAASSSSDWVIMPAGARPTFMGIHGGTMPVSLLVAADGSALISFVGHTGNDFLNMLRRKSMRAPSFLQSQKQLSPLSLPNRSNLTAGSPGSNMPVFNLSGESLWRMNILADQMLPFGLSDEPLSIEGQAQEPQQSAVEKSYRRFFKPQYLQPRHSSD